MDVILYSIGSIKSFPMTLDTAGKYCHKIRVAISAPLRYWYIVVMARDGGVRAIDDTAGYPPYTHDRQQKTSSQREWILE